MYWDTTLLISLIVVYYVVHGRKFLSLDRIAEPPFVVNVAYLLNFPVRALVLLFFDDVTPAAPSLVWDIDTCNVVLVYASACTLVFNFSYEYFSRGHVLRGDAAVPALPPLQPIPVPVLGYFALLATVVVYFLLTSRTAINFTYDLGESDIPQIVNAIWFALDVSISGSLMMFLITRRPTYLAAFAFFLGSLLYHSFLLTAKYALLGYLVIFLFVLKRAGFALRTWHVVAALLVSIPYVIASYSLRDFDLGAIRPEATLAEQISLVLSLLEGSSLGDVVTDLFLIRMTDRFVYLEAFMVYLQALDQGVALDLYDKFGSLATYKRAIPSIFGVDKSEIQNIHSWFGNKYWYGLPFDDYYSVIIPFGRVTESFVIFGWAGFMFFAFYAWLFAWLYKRFFCSQDPLLVIYYFIIFYNYILVDDNLLYNFSGILWGSIFFFGSMFVLRLFMKHTTAETSDPRAIVHRRN